MITILQHAGEALHSEVDFHDLNRRLASIWSMWVAAGAGQNSAMVIFISRACPLTVTMPQPRSATLGDHFK